MTTASVPIEAKPDSGSERRQLVRPASHRVRDAAVVSVIAVTQLAWMALLAYGFFYLLA